MENANLCFSPYEKPWRTASHKCTRFNIINIIWLPLCLPRAWLLSPGGCRRRWRTAFTESAWEGDLGGRRGAGGGSGRPVCPHPCHRQPLGPGGQGPQATGAARGSVHRRPEARDKAAASVVGLPSRPGLLPLTTSELLRLGSEGLPRGPPREQPQ